MLIHRPWIRATSPLRSNRVLHLDAYVMANALAAYLDLHATLGGTQRRSRDVLDVTSYPPHMVAMASLPSDCVRLTWSARERAVPWQRLHAYVTHQAELLRTPQLGLYPWSMVTLVCHYVSVTDTDAFKGWSRIANITTKRKLITLE